MQKGRQEELEVCRAWGDLCEGWKGTAGLGKAQMHCKQPSALLLTDLLPFVAVPRSQAGQPVCPCCPEPPGVQRGL